MATQIKVRRIMGKPLERLAGFPIPRRVLVKMAICLVEVISSESKHYFAKRGWKGHDPMGGPPIWDSFKYSITGQHIEITSSFYGMKELVSQRGIPGRKMTWLTQEAKQRRPLAYKLTAREKFLGKKRSGSRLALVVPIETVAGHIEFRMAPLKMAGAWVHPGIARFSFIDNAVRKGRVACGKVLQNELPRILRENR